MVTCQIDGCDQRATYHITDFVESRVLHYCEQHARQNLAGTDDQRDSSANVELDSYCFKCGHDDKSYSPTTPSFVCPSCSRHIRDITGTQHSVVTDSIVPDHWVHKYRCIPILINGNDLTVVHDFAKNEQIGAFRFVMNRRFFVVFAQPHHIDALLDAYF